jgi:hypothetical protein
MSKIQKVQLENQEGYGKLNEENGLIFCWPCILIFFVLKSNQMHHFSFICLVNQLLHVSGMFIAHH